MCQATCNPLYYLVGSIKKLDSRLDSTGPAIVIAPHLQVATNVLRRFALLGLPAFKAQKGRGPGCAS